MKEFLDGNVAIDFSELFGEPGGAEPVEEPRAEQAGALAREHEREEAELQHSREIYKTYQENTKISEQLQTSILRGVHEGEDIYTLFLKAAKAISLMVNNNTFYNQVEADTLTIYGKGLQQNEPLRIELEAIKTRLQRLMTAHEETDNADEKKRLEDALRAHTRKAEQLEKLL